MAAWKDPSKRPSRAWKRIGRRHEPAAPTTASTCWRTSQDFTRKGGGMTMRSYQLAPARAILESIRLSLGLDFVVIMPRQAGKDELLAHLKAYLMRVMCRKDRGIVEVNPTYKPQTIDAMLRLENRLDANLLTASRWKKRSDFMRMIGGCRTAFYSGDGQANVVGATADLCLIINEAQDILPPSMPNTSRRWPPAGPPRASSAARPGPPPPCWRRCCAPARRPNSRTACGGSSSTPPRTCAGRTRSTANSWMARCAAWAASIPFIKTQYFCEEIDAQAGMFPPGRQALMYGSHPARTEPEPGKLYCLPDRRGRAGRGPIGQSTGPATGEVRTAAETRPAIPPPSRSSRSTCARLPALGKPTYRVVQRRAVDRREARHGLRGAAGAGRGLAAAPDRHRCHRRGRRAVVAAGERLRRGRGHAGQVHARRSRASWATASSASSKAGATRSTTPSTRPSGCSSTRPSPRSCPARPN